MGNCMRVLFNSLCTLRTRTGVGHYAAELGDALRQRPGADVECFPTGWVRSAVAAMCRLRPKPPSHQPSAAPSVWTRLRGAVKRVGAAGVLRAAQDFERITFRLAARRGFDLYHEPNYLPFPTDLPTVVTVHDLSVLLHPHWHPADRVRAFTKRFEAGLKRARHLVAVSEFTRREVIRHLDWPADRVSVTPNGVRGDLRPVPPDEAAAALRGFGLAPGYLLHVGTLEPRKNVLMLLKAYCSLPAELRERSPLVLVGGYGWDSAEIVDFVNGEGRRQNVRWLGYVPDAAFPALYSAARALVFPTHYEGFGLPAVEMMACGGAVLASTAGAVAEVTGGRAHLTDPHDADGWRGAMRRACEDGDWLAVLRRAAEHVARRFTWDRCADRTLDAYRAALGVAVPAGVGAARAA